LYKFKFFKYKIIGLFKDLDNDLGKPSLTSRVVPLPGFTINNIQAREVKYNLMRFFLNMCLLLFIPRWYKVSRNDKNRLSPFSSVIYYGNDDIYDNPAIEAVINFRWRKAKNSFFFLFFRFIIFAICFALVSWAYLVHEVISDGYLKFLVTLIVIFYYLAIYLFATEMIQLNYYGYRKYFSDIFNRFDIISIVLSVTVMTMMLTKFQFSDGFGSVETIDTGLMMGIAFSIFFLWIEFVGFGFVISYSSIFNSLIQLLSF